MKMHEFNKDKRKTALLIHPMLSSAEDITVDLTDYWKDEIHCFVPDLSAHGEDIKSTFYSAVEEAKSIHDILAEQNCTHLELGFGASLGGVVLFELLKYSDLEFEHICFEGVSFYEHAAFLFFVLSKAFLFEHHTAAKKPEIFVKQMSKIYGEKAGPAMAENFMNMNENSIKNIIRACAYVELPELSKEIQKRCVFAFGNKDSDLKKCRKLLPEKYPDAELKIWTGYGHCGRMTEDSAEYAAMLKSYLK